MAIDTAAKRRSALRLTIPAPDGTITQGDRQHVTYNYSGILAIELVLFMVVYGSASLAPWIVQASAAALTPWVALADEPALLPWVAVTTADIEDLTP